MSVADEALAAEFEAGAIDNRHLFCPEACSPNQNPASITHSMLPRKCR